MCAAGGDSMGVFPSGQWGQTVNLLLFSYGGSNPPAPTTKYSAKSQDLALYFYAYRTFDRTLTALAKKV